MRLKAALTKKETIFVLACLIFLLINVGAISTGGQRRAKRAVCLTNLRQLTLAWTEYADDNDVFIVNGAPMRPTECQADLGLDMDHYGEIPWVGRDWHNNYMSGQQLSEECQESAIRAGALWPYCQELKLYHCPSGCPGGIRNYSIVDGMNGMSRVHQGTIAGVHWIKNITQIVKPAERLVFIDEGWVTPDSYGVNFDEELWWDDPSAMHGGGMSVSFADGHSEWHRWKGKWTIAKGTSLYYSGPSRPGDPIDGEYIPATIDDFYDLYWTQIGCWSELGYTPTH